MRYLTFAINLPTLLRFWESSSLTVGAANFSTTLTHLLRHFGRQSAHGVAYLTLAFLTCGQKCAVIWPIHGIVWKMGCLWIHWLMSNLPIKIAISEYPPFLDKPTYTDIQILKYCLLSSQSVSSTWQWKCPCPISILYPSHILGHGVS